MKTLFFYIEFTFAVLAAAGTVIILINFAKIIINL